MICRVCGSEAGLYDTIWSNITDVTGFYNKPVEKYIGAPAAVIYRLNHF